jgi:hypothetical protein
VTQIRTKNQPEFAFLTIDKKGYFTCNNTDNPRLTLFTIPFNPIQFNSIHSFINMDRIVARKKTHDLKAGLSRPRKLRSRPCARTEEDNKPLRPIELLQQIIDQQLNDEILVVTNYSYPYSKSKEQGEPTAQQIVSPMWFSTCRSPDRPLKRKLLSPQKRVRFADDEQVVTVVSYKQSLSKEEKAQMWWTGSEMYEFRQKSKYFVKQDQLEQQE